MDNKYNDDEVAATKPYVAPKDDFVANKQHFEFLKEIRDGVDNLVKSLIKKDPKSSRELTSAVKAEVLQKFGSIPPKLSPHTDQDFGKAVPTLQKMLADKQAAGVVLPPSLILAIEALVKSLDPSLLPVVTLMIEILSWF